MISFSICLECNFYAFITKEVDRLKEVENIIVNNNKYLIENSK